MDRPEKGEVKVKVTATAICHSVLHALEGLFLGKLPGVPGHQTAGYMDEVEEGATTVKPGNPV